MLLLSDNKNTSLKSVKSSCRSLVTVLDTQYAETCYFSLWTKRTSTCNFPKNRSTIVSWIGRKSHNRWFRTCKFYFKRNLETFLFFANMMIYVILARIGLVFFRPWEDCKLSIRELETLLRKISWVEYLFVEIVSSNRNRCIEVEKDFPKKRGTACHKKRKKKLLNWLTADARCQLILFHVSLVIPRHFHPIPRFFIRASSLWNELNLRRNGGTVEK